MMNHRALMNKTAFQDYGTDAVNIVSLETATQRFTDRWAKSEEACHTRSLSSQDAKEMIERYANNSLYTILKQVNRATR